MDTQRYKELFLSEAQEHIDSLDSGLLTLEKNPHDPTLIKELMRHSHTLKGMASTMGYGEISNLAHSFEGMLENLKNNISSSNIEILFGALDELRFLISRDEDSETDAKDSTFLNDTEKLPTNEKKHLPTHPLTEVIGELEAQDTKVSEKIVNNPEVFRKISSVKVSIEKLDKLLEIISELSLNKLQFENASPELKEDIQQLIEQNSKFINELQYMVLKLRLTPMEQVFNRFPRMVRDLSKKLNKDIEFEIYGNEIEVDKEVLDNVAEPIIHILRNSIDHGIEKQGKIILRAYQKEQNVVITIEDNGRGINWQRIEQKLGKKLTNKNEREDAIFSGVSTNDTVTEVSGRGIGLYTVKNNVERLGGHLKLDTETNKGTKFEIHLPISATIMKALISKIGREIFAIPLNNIEKILQLEQFEVFSQMGQDMILLEEKEIPLIDLAIKLNQEVSTMNEGAKYKNRIGLITQINESKYAFVINDLEGEQDIIVKQIPDEIRKKINLSAVTILGNGRPVPVLDFAYLMDTV
jgi:two-component system, chemotaxis family, sensor kinase CheA